MLGHTSKKVTQVHRAGDCDALLYSTTIWRQTSLMFTCSACLRNLITSLAADLPGVSANRLSRSSHSVLPPRNLRNPNAQTVRTSATLRGLSKPHHRRVALDVLKSKSKLRTLTGNKKRDVTKGSPSSERARQANAKQSLTTQGKTKLEIQAQKEAVFLVDPLRLANTVLDNLREDNYEKAKALVIASDRYGATLGRPAGSVNNVVSWNHLMDYLMAKHQPKDALHLLQDMKKRGHSPDAYTYTILLRGLAENHAQMGDKAAVTAVKLYNGMFAPNSDVKTSTLITNAALTVCAKSGDMDALWSIAGRMPQTRRGSADHWTYTTVLNAMQSDLRAKMSEAGSGEEYNRLREISIEKTMNDARMLWREVIAKWRSADVVIDEKLVSAMGRLLLTSKRKQDALDVFELVRQVMGVHVHHQSLEETRRSLQEHNATSEEADEGDSLSDEARSTPEERQNGTGQFKTFDLVNAQDTALSQVYETDAKQPLYAKPGNNVLSLVLEAAADLLKAHIGKAYWELLTDPAGQYQIEPDTQNCLAYMRLLRASRSARSALDMLQRDWTGPAADFLRRRGTYVVAMSTCVRNRLNPEIFTIASRMLDIMQDKASEAREAREIWEDEESDADAAIGRPVRPKQMQVEVLDMDPKVLTMYLEIATNTTKGVSDKLPLKRLPNGDLDYEREAGKNNTMRALNRLGPDTVDLLRLVKLATREFAYKARFESLPAAAKRKMKLPTRVGEKAEDLLGFLKAMNSAYDRILRVNYRLEEEGMGPLDKSLLMDVRVQRVKVTSYVQSLSQAMGLQNDDRSRPAGQTRQRPLSRRQKQEKERQRRSNSLIQTMVRTGKSEDEVRQERAVRAQRKPRATGLQDEQSMWGHDLADSYNSTFTELRR
jgi:pentatricopeptide repeat protein